MNCQNGCFLLGGLYPLPMTNRTPEVQRWVMRSPAAFVQRARGASIREGKKDNCINSMPSSSHRIRKRTPPIVVSFSWSSLSFRLNSLL